MPGFTLIYQHQGLDESVRARAEKLVKASFKTEFISNSDKLILLFRDGNHYPYEIIKHGGYLVIVEGNIYSTEPSTDLHFKQQAVKSFSKFDSAYFHNLDGEFIIYVIHPETGRIVVINDYLARLPLYFQNKRQFILSRDIYVLDKVSTGLSFDERSVYQYLRLGYPLGQRTLFYDINRLPPSSSVFIDGESLNINSTKISLDELEGSYGGTKAEEALYECFREAVNDRLVKKEKIIVSLSGGLDSRLIMGQIEKSSLFVDYASFLYDNAIIKNDIKVVKQLGKLFKRTPEIISLEEYAPEFFDEMAKAKGGMNYLGMAFIIRYLKQISTSHTFMLTGDGGDKTLPYLFPPRKLNNKELARYILKQNMISKKKVLDNFLMFEIDQEEKAIVDYLNNLPGKNNFLKYKSYLIFERMINWLFEGEDRNRTYMWSSSPFYQPRFFKLAHSISELEKKNFSLFRKFSKLVNESLNTIPNANWGIPLEDTTAINRMYFRQKLKSYLPHWKWSSINDSDTHLEMAESVTAMMQNGFGGQLYMNAVYRDLKSANDEMLYHLISLLKVSEMTWKNP